MGLIRLRGGGVARAEGGLLVVSSGRVRGLRGGGRAAVGVYGGGLGGTVGILGGLLVARGGGSSFVRRSRLFVGDGRGTIGIHNRGAVFFNRGSVRFSRGAVGVGGGLFRSQQKVGEDGG